MSVSKKGYITTKGIEIGDSVQKLKEAYPDIRMNSGDSNDGEYEKSKEDQYDYMRFEVKEGLVTKIKIFNLIP
ncbi:hypothetical protein [Paenibacillus sp. GCM10027626]|uniref:hypothetical protein n=1 Tax=Paenibacillus sp. GCM10027626 TaxID=3273411 RepID=UPI00362A391D